MSSNPPHWEVYSIHTTLCNQVCHCLAADRWFSPDTMVSSANKTAHHDIAEIWLKVA